MEKDDSTQRNPKNKQNNVGRFLDGKGFYIVLSICAVVIAVSAGMLMWGGTDDRTNVEDLSNSNDYVNSNVGDMTMLGDDETQKVPDDEAGVPENDGSHGAVNAGPFDTDVTVPGDEDEEVIATMNVTSPEDEGEKETAQLAFIWPLSGNIATEYSVDELVYNKTMMAWRTHAGLDIEASIGTKVMAAADGTVADVRDDDMYGTTVVIDHGAGLMSVYSNLARVPTVKPGDTVALGAVIGAVGDTAIGEAGEVAHLHFAMSLDGDSVDPGEYLPRRN